MLLLYFFDLFICFWLCWVFVAASLLSAVVASGGSSPRWFSGTSLLWLLLLQGTGSSVQAQY